MDTTHKYEKSDFTTFSRDELRAAFNDMVPIAVFLGTQDRGCQKKVDRFADTPKALERCERIRSFIRAGRQSEAAFAREESLPSAQEETISAGRARLLDSGHADALREQVLVDQAAALERVSGRPAKEPRKKEVKLAKTVREPKRAAAKAKKEKANGAGGASRSRLDLEATITKLVDGNPKREGSAAHAAFALYRTGMRVATFVQKLAELGQEGAAAVHLRHDVGKGYVKYG